MGPNLEPGWLDPYRPVPAKPRSRCACPRPRFPTVAIGIGGECPGKSALPTPGAFGSNPRRGSTQASGLYLTVSAARSCCRTREFPKCVQGKRNDAILLSCIEMFFYHIYIRFISHSIQRTCVSRPKLPSRPNSPLGLGGVSCSCRSSSSPPKSSMLILQGERCAAVLSRQR